MIFPQATKKAMQEDSNKVDTSNALQNCPQNNSNMAEEPAQKKIYIAKLTQQQLQQL